MLIIHKGLSIYYVSSYNKAGSFRMLTSGRHFASASDLLALTVALARILALKR